MSNNDAEVIKEFLVAVGVKVDENALSKFDGIIASIGGGVLKMAAALGAAALATEKFVDKVSQPLEDLYWAGKRLHSGVAQIQDYALAIQNLGGTADGARGSLESIARLLRTNPGYSGFLNSLGVNPNQGAVGIAKNLVTRLKSSGMPYYIAERYGSMFGIDEGTFWAEWNAKSGEIDRSPFAQAYKNAHTNADEAAEKAHDVQVQLRDVGVQFNVLSVNMMTHLLPAVQALNREILKNSPATLGGANKAQDTISNVISSSGFASRLSDKEATQAAKNSANVLPSLARSVEKTVGDWVAAFGIRETFEGMGWSKEDAAGITAQAIAESSGNYKASGDHGHAYGLFQWQGARQAQFKKWSGGKDIKEATIDEQMRFANYELTKGDYKDVGKAIRGVKDPAKIGDILSRRWMRPAAVERDAATRAGLATSIVNLNQKTDIHVSGSNPGATGKAVASHQDRVNGDLARNLKGVVK